MRNIVLIIIFSFFIFLIFGIDSRASVIYDTLVDQTHGFYKVYERNDSTIRLFSENNTIRLAIGDTVTWSNNAFPEIRLTIMSEPNLWNNSGDLTMNNKRFSYKFNESGTYIIYIKQFPSLKQTIIVGGQNSVINTNISNINESNINVTNISNINESNQSMIIETTKTNNSKDQGVINTPALVKQTSINSSNETSNSSINTNNIILLLVFLSMVILSRKLEDKYCEKRKKN